MKSFNMKKTNVAFTTFFLSGICAISSGIIVSMLQETYNFHYGMTGVLLALMNIGNLLSGLLAGILPARLGPRRTILLLTIGYFLGYLLLGISMKISIFMIAFFLLGIAKGSTMNTCTIFVSDHTSNRTKGMNILHACYALGALLCPVIIAIASLGNNLTRGLFTLTTLGAVLWLLFFSVQTSKKERSLQKAATDWSFLHSKRFWLLTCLLFCQNAVEISVSGWMVTYFKESKIISSSLSPYTVTVMWGATLIARMLIAFIFPIKNKYSAMIKMSLGCTIFYTGLILADSQTTVLLLLAAFAFSLAGINPTAVSCAGKITSVTSIGVMLPVASLGAILMPWFIGVLSEYAGLKIGMLANIIPCVGLLICSTLSRHLANE